MQNDPEPLWKNLKSMLDSMNLKQQTIDTYNATAHAMARKFNNIGGRVDDIERGFSSLKNEHPFVLEIGCGNGRDAMEILKRTDQYLGMDISTSMIEIARAVAPRGTFVVADIDAYEFPSGIDLIFSFASLLHSDPTSIKHILERAAHALNPHGIFYISLKYGEGQHTKTDEFGTRTYFYYTPNDIKEFAGNAYEVLSEITEEFQKQKWFTMVLRKK